MDDASPIDDLSAKLPDKVKALKALWDEWNAKNVIPLRGAAEDRGIGLGKAQV
jgi:hypothetical protein